MFQTKKAIFNNQLSIKQSICKYGLSFILIVFFFTAFINCSSKVVDNTDYYDFELNDYVVCDWSSDIQYLNDGKKIEINLHGMCKNLGIEAPGTDGVEMNSGQYTNFTLQNEIAKLYERQVFLIRNYQSQNSYITELEPLYNQKCSAEQSFYRVIREIEFTNANLNQFIDTLTVPSITEKELLNDLFNIPVWISLNQTNYEEYVTEIIQETREDFQFLYVYLSTDDMDQYTDNSNKITCAINVFLEKAEEYLNKQFELAEEILTFAEESYEIRKKFISDTIVTDQSRDIDIVTAKQQGLIDYRVISSPNFQGKGLNLEITVLTDQQVNLYVPANMDFNANSRKLSKNFTSKKNLLATGINFNIFSNNNTLSKENHACNYQTIMNTITYYFPINSGNTSGNWLETIDASDGYIFYRTRDLSGASYIYFDSERKMTYIIIHNNYNTAIELSIFEEIKELIKDIGYGEFVYTENCEEGVIEIEFNGQYAGELDLLSCQVDDSNNESGYNFIKIWEE